MKASMHALALLLSCAAASSAGGCGDPRPANQPETPSSVATADPSTPAPAGPLATPFDLGAFAYPGSAELTSGHVTANVGEISWRAHVSNDPPEKVIAFFQARFGKGEPMENGEVVWRDNADATRDAGSVMPVEAPGPHHDGTKIPDDARTVILTSTMNAY